MAPDLKKCPFCPTGNGEYRFKYIEAPYGEERMVVRVRCDLCHAQSPYQRNPLLHGWHYSLEEAAEAWNRRADDV